MCVFLFMFVGSCLASSPGPLRGERAWVHTVNACVDILRKFAVKYRIAGNFRGRKLSRIGKKGAFRGENFRGTLNLVA